MKTLAIQAAALAAAVMLSCPGAFADAATGTTEGIHYVVGGIGLDESAQMQADSLNHSLSLRTAAYGSGAYLSDVDLTVTDASGRRLFHQRLDGPWLLIDLPPGRYSIEGIHEGQVAHMNVTLASHGHRSAVMYFVADSGTRPLAGEKP